MRDDSSKCTKCRYYCRAGTTSLMSHFGLCGLVVGYCIMGAFLFEFLEAGNEQLKRNEIRRRRSTLTDSLWSFTKDLAYLDESNWTQHATDRLRRFETTLVHAVRKEGYDGNEDAQLQWSFTGALLYSIIVITTIGYGNIAPKTPQGKIVTILYAIVGIPLMLLCLSNIGDAMAQSFKFTYRYICCYLCRKPKKPKRSKSSFRQHVRSNRGPPPDYKLGPEDNKSSYGTVPGTARSDASGFGSPATTTQPTLGSPRYSPRPPSVTNTITRRHQYDIDAARVPIITNKYVLQNGEESHPDSSLYCPPGPPLPAPPHSLTLPSSHHPHSAKRCTWQDDPDLADDESGSDDSDEQEEEQLTVPIWLCVGIVVGYICGGALLFSSWEDWGFLDSSYFCFVTLTTIGFGDLVPGTALSDDAQVTLAICAVYLLFGMALLAMSFNLVQEEVTKSVKCIGKRLGILSDDDDDN